MLSERGVAALYETMAAETDLVARELAWAGGERRLTDLRHIAELLHASALESGARARRLTSWLRDRSSESGSDTAPEDRSRRLESDAEAVQIQTIHRSKGLEFPIVYLPYMWTAFPDNDLMPLYHDSENGDRRTVDVGGDRWEGFQRHKTRAYDERRAEDLRQAYVALTRARHQVVVWWVTSFETKGSSLARLVLGPGRASPLLAPPAQVPANDDLVSERLGEVARRAPGRISVERVVRPEPAGWGGPGGGAVPRDMPVRPGPGRFVAPHFVYGDHRRLPPLGVRFGRGERGGDAGARRRAGAGARAGLVGARGRGSHR